MLNLVRIVSTLICVQWIEPSMMAVWTYLTVYETYFMIFRFGVFNAFNREYAYLLGKSESKSALEYLNTTETFALILSVFIGITFFLSMTFFQMNLPFWTFGVLIFSMVLPIKIYAGFKELCYRSGSDFKKFAIIQYWTIFANIVGIIFVYMNGFEGFLWRVLFIHIVILVVTLINRPQKFKLFFDGGIFIRLFKDGIPLFFSNYGQSLLSTFPVWFLSYFVGPIAVGLFYPVSLVVSLVGMLPGIISIYLLPQLNFALGRDQDPSSIIERSKSTTSKTAFYLLPFCVIGMLLVPFFISWVLPKYSEAILASQIAFLLGWFQVFNLLGNPFSVLKSWNLLYQNIIIQIVIHALIPFTLMTIIKTEYKIELLLISLILSKIFCIIVNYFQLSRLKMNKNRIEIN